MGMEGGRYGTLYVEMTRFYLGIREIWADFLRFVYPGVDSPAGADISGVKHA